METKELIQVCNEKILRIAPKVLADDRKAAAVELAVKCFMSVAPLKISPQGLVPTYAMRGF